MKFSSVITGNYHCTTHCLLFACNRHSANCCNSCVFSIIPPSLPYKPIVFWGVSLLKAGFLWLHHQCKVLQGMQKYLSRLMQTAKPECLLKEVLLQWAIYNWHFKHISLPPLLFYNPEVVEHVKRVVFFHRIPFSHNKQIINPMEVTIMTSWCEISLIKVKEGCLDSSSWGIFINLCVYWKQTLELLFLALRLN